MNLEGIPHVIDTILSGMVLLSASQPTSTGQQMSRYWRCCLAKPTTVWGCPGSFQPTLGTKWGAICKHPPSYSVSWTSPLSVSLSACPRIEFGFEVPQPKQRDTRNCSLWVCVCVCVCVRFRLVCTRSGGICYWYFSHAG